ncbi:MAG: hypothetical protein ACLQK4_11800 [Acidimicrobiales bacterium]|jgi:hypothetical protein
MADTKQKATDARTEVAELIALIKAYAIQETLGPLKRIGRTLAFGSAAAVTFGIAAVLSLVGLLRALQTETGSAFAGEWTWVPYLLTVIAAVAFLGAAAALALRSPRSEQP